MKRKIIKIISWIMLVASIVYIIYLAYLCFLNPDMTSTRFFLTYWKQELSCVILSGISVNTLAYLSKKEGRSIG